MSFDLEELSQVNRPMTLPEVAAGFGLSAAVLRRVALAHRVDPACRVAGVACFGPRQLRRLYEALVFEYGEPEPEVEPEPEPELVPATKGRKSRATSRR